MFKAVEPSNLKANSVKNKRKNEKVTSLYDNIILGKKKGSPDL